MLIGSCIAALSITVIYPLIENIYNDACNSSFLKEERSKFLCCVHTCTFMSIAAGFLTYGYVWYIDGFIPKPSLIENIKICENDENFTFTSYEVAYNNFSIYYVG